MNNTLSHNGIKYCQNNSLYNRITIDVSLIPDHPLHTIDKAEQLQLCEIIWKHIQVEPMTLHYRKSKRSQFTLSVVSDDKYIYQVFVLRYGNSNYTRITMIDNTDDNLNDFIVLSNTAIAVINNPRNNTIDDNHRA